MGVGGIGLGGHHEIDGVFADVWGDQDLAGDIAEGEDLFAVDDLIDLDFLAVGRSTSMMRPALPWWDSRR